jgi:prepilin-type N-terminal cleavage/methylation domain-containing protein
MLKQTRRGFTLVEVLIVVVILGILAATVLPQFTSANNDAKESALVQDLQTFRSQIELYEFQHESKHPGQLGDTFTKHMLLSTDVKGISGVPGSKPFGPYFVGQLPPNPFTGKRDVKVIDDNIDAYDCNADTDGEGLQPAGWVYSKGEGRLRPIIKDTEKAADGTVLNKL